MGYVSCLEGNDFTVQYSNSKTSPRTVVLLAISFSSICRSFESSWEWIPCIVWYFNAKINVLSARSSEIKSRLTKFNLNAIWLVEPLRGRRNCQLMDHYRFLLSVKDITACCNIQDSSHAIMLPASQVPQNEYVLIQTNAILNAMWQCVDLLILSQHLERQDHPWCLRHCNGGRLNPGCAPCKKSSFKQFHQSGSFQSNHICYHYRLITLDCCT